MQGNLTFQLKHSFVTVPAGWCHEGVQVLSSRGLLSQTVPQHPPTPWGAHKGLGRHREVLARPAAERGSVPSQLLPHTPPSGGGPDPTGGEWGCCRSPRDPPKGGEPCHSMPKPLWLWPPWLETLQCAATFSMSHPDLMQQLSREVTD